MSRLPLLSRIPRAIRRMHSDGRQVNPPGASASPSSAPHISQASLSQSPVPQDPPSQPLLSRSLSLADPLKSHSPGGPGKLKPHRPPRLVPVSLPNGDPVPSKYPPSDEYFDALEERKPHPLWKFFHVPIDQTTQLTESSTSSNNTGSVEVLEAENRNLYSGRAWLATELRRKSFADLHTLWYVLLRERNVLTTQREERLRLKISMGPDATLLSTRAARCRKSMARIKYVLNERRLGLIAAAGPHRVGHRIQVPWSASQSTDPAGMTAAILGEVEVPDILKAKRKRSPAAKASAKGEDVAAEEIEARDEGFGGGEEAKDFVNDVEVTGGGRVEKKE